MTAAVLLLFAPLPVAADKPGTAWFARVDFVVWNRVITFHELEDAWGRVTHTPAATYWISYYTLLWTPPLACHGISVPFGFANRGWSTDAGTLSIVPCTEGWLLESTTGLTIISAALWVIDSDYDWELRNRRIFRPIKKP